MRPLNFIGTFCGILFISVQGFPSADTQPPVEVGGYHGPTSNTYRQDFDNPKEKLGEMTGTIKSIDRISGTLSVLDDKGAAVKFTIDESARLEDHHLQINLADLHVGDRVVVHFNVDPQLVNSIDRL